MLELAAYIAKPNPDWNDIIDAAGAGFRRELKISWPCWIDACATMGRRTAAITMAIISTKPDEQFTRGAGAYFTSMAKRAEAGELHLDDSIWAFKNRKWVRGRKNASPIRVVTRMPNRNPNIWTKNAPKSFFTAARCKLWQVAGFAATNAGQIIRLSHANEIIIRSRSAIDDR